MVNRVKSSSRFEINEGFASMPTSYSPGGALLGILSQIHLLA
jgi:hypothetical protein